MTITLTNRQRKIPLRIGWLRRFAWLAAAECRDVSADDKFALKHLPEVEVTILSDRVIGRLHEQFMNIPGATDVITFEHGEIVMSADTAKQYAAEHGHSIEEELALYTVHGLLHLNGFEDATSRDATRMHKVQDRIWKECLAQLPKPSQS